MTTEEEFLALKSINEVIYGNPFTVVLFPEKRNLIRKVLIGHPRKASESDHEKAKDKVFAQLFNLGFREPFFIPLEESQDRGDSADYVDGW
jgi:hypothetical protein